MKTESSEISIQSIQFLIRHPWLFICPIVIVLSTVLSYVSLMPEQYQTTAVLSVETVTSLGDVRGSAFDAKFTQKKIDLVDRLLIGKNLNSIITEAWPGVNDTTRLAEYNDIAARLRKPKKGLSTTYDRKDSNILYVSFVDTSPALSYRVVAAAVKTLRRLSKELSEQDQAAGVVFLKRQLDFYKEKLKAVDDEMAAIKMKFREMDPYLSREDKDLISEVISDPSFKQSAGDIVVQKSVKYEEILANLNLQLLEARKKVKTIKMRIDTKDFAPRPDAGQNVNDDPLIREYSQQIASQQMLLSGLIAKGYTEEHPDAKTIRMSIEDLNLLRENRVGDLTGAKSSTELSDNAKKIAEETLKRELADTYSFIDMLKDKIALIEKYQKVSEDKLKPDHMRATVVSNDISRLKELKNENEISTRYYADLRKKLEEAEIKSRIDESSLGFEIKVIDPPKEPIKPLPFKKATILLMGLIAAVGSGAGLAYIADALDKSMKSSVELRNLLKIPVIASVERMLTSQDVRLRKRRMISTIIYLAVFAVFVRLIMGMFIKTVVVK